MYHNAQREIRQINNTESRRIIYLGMLLTLISALTSGLVRPRRIGILGQLGPDDEGTKKGGNLFLGRYGAIFQKN